MTGEQHWWRTFFEGPPMEVWRRLVPQAQTQAEVELLASEMNAPPASVLDIACGEGRLAIPMARLGFRVTAVDWSEYCLTGGKRDTDGLEIAWERRDMRDLPWPAAFAGAYCFGNSFGYLDDSGNHDFLAAVADALRPGGVFVLDCVPLENALPQLDGDRWFRAGDLVMLRSGRYEPATGRMEVDYTFIRDGRTDTRHVSQAFYPYRQLCRLLADVGLVDPRAYANARREPYDVRSPGVILCTRRR